MATKSISQLDSQATAQTTDLFEVAVVDAGSGTGYASKKESAAVVADGIVNSFTYPTAMPNMQNKTIAGALNTLLANFAPVYSASSTYSEGDIVTYNGALYVANTDISTAEAWNSSHWDSTTAAESGGGGGGGGSASRNFSTTKHKVGKWVDGKDIWEQTYVFDYTDFHNQTLDSTVQKGQFWLDIPTTYDMMWLDQSASYLMNTVTTGTAVKSHPLNFGSSGGVYTRANIQRTDTSNNGKPFVYYENTYSASAWYSIISSWRWIITVQWTEATT